MITNSNHLVPGWKSIKQPYQKGVSCYAPKTNSQLANHRAPNECVFICETVQKAATAVCRIKRAQLFEARTQRSCLRFAYDLKFRWYAVSLWRACTWQWIFSAPVSTPWIIAYSYFCWNEDFLLTAHTLKEKQKRGDEFSLPC